VSYCVRPFRPSFTFAGKVISLHFKKGLQVELQKGLLGGTSRAPGEAGAPERAPIGAPKGTPGGAPEKTPRGALGGDPRKGL